MAKFPRPLPRIATGLSDSWRAGYGLSDLRHDLMAGLTIGTVAVPLSMALAIATGVPPQHGLYTAIVAGAIIALTGGSRFNVSGPTAAFVAILFPIVQQFGLGGLLVATLMAGIILVAMGISGLGRLIQFVPYPVVLGFTAGIAVVIAMLQVPDFLGLNQLEMGEHFFSNLARLATATVQFDPTATLIGSWTLVLLLLWPRLGLPIPAPLAGLVLASLAVFAINRWSGIEVETIASRFTWEAQGEHGKGIPPLAPSFILPWQLPGPDGNPLLLNFALFQALLGPAFAIAMLAAIESLLCAVVADGLTRTRHDPNAELIGQGLGNIVAPLFGGITATAAIARTATNVRSGARSPLAAVIHAAVVLLAVIGLAGLLGLVPMAALAALLLVVAWNMSEARHVWHTLRSAPAGDVTILLLCFVLTVVFDMVLAVAVGTGLAAALFIRRMALLTSTQRLEENHALTENLPRETVVYDIDGPLFFAAAEKALHTLRHVDAGIRTVILDMRDVPSMDGTAIAALGSLVNEIQHQGAALILVGLPPRIILKLRRAGIRTRRGKLSHRATLETARTLAWRWREGLVDLPARSA
ncbi:C4-dicarboxylic acid transporter DauA [Halomonas sp. Bachu 37]|uniref:C4-dicarboxylic acid transporter DauA n=1 Tax=Halomonas kashgarensis TaxID=3084920 RepID=UPI0032169531